MDMEKVLRVRKDLHRKRQSMQEHRYQSDQKHSQAVEMLQLVFRGKQNRVNNKMEEVYQKVPAKIMMLGMNPHDYTTEEKLQFIRMQ